MQPECGFLYSLSGAARGHAPGLAVSLYSLRKVGHTEPVVVAYTAEAAKFARLLADDPRLAVQLRETTLEPVNGKFGHQHRHLMTKAKVQADPPFERTIFLDADTLLVEKLDELWQHNFCVAQIGDRVRDDGRPVINVGLIGYHDTPEHRELFRTIPDDCAKHSGDDQDSIERRLPPWATILPVDWNVVPKYWDTCRRPKMLHFVGGCYKVHYLWQVYFDRVIKEDWGGGYRLLGPPN